MTLEPAPQFDVAGLVARARAATGPDGRLAVPDSVAWEIFPYEGDLRVKPLAVPAAEQPRAGESADDCRICATPDADFFWVDQRWRLGPAGEPTPVPALVLWPRAHLDLGDLDDDLAAELGVLQRRVERALAGVAGVARVHVNRWGDGAAHLHVWFFGRPEGLPQLRGSCLPEWLDILPPLPEDEATAIARHVAAQLAAWRGTAGPEGFPG